MEEEIPHKIFTHTNTFIEPLTERALEIFFHSSLPEKYFWSAKFHNDTLMIILSNKFPRNVLKYYLSRWYGSATIICLEYNLECLEYSMSEDIGRIVSINIRYEEGRGKIRQEYDMDLFHKLFFIHYGFHYKNCLCCCNDMNCTVKWTLDN